VKQGKAHDDQASKISSPLRVAFVLCPNFTLMAFAGFIDMLRLCGDDGDRSRQIYCQWTVLGATIEPVRASCGVLVTPWETFRDPRAFEYIVVVGGQLDESQAVDPRLVAYLRRAAKLGVTLVGVCTGSFVLARAKLMSGRRCCVHWYHYKDFLREFEDVQPVVDEIFVDEHDRITCAGGTAVIDLAAYLVNRHNGNVVARKGIRQIMLEWARPPKHVQMPLLNEFFEVTDPRIRQAIQYMEDNLGSPIRVAEIAAQANLSVRQFDRKFREAFGLSPSALFRKIKVQRAEWLLAHTQRSITQIAFDCGFADSSHLSRVFRQTYGAQPRALRRRIAGGTT
jgi:transcriptional regulator GlxA family with amidase domain